LQVREGPTVIGTYIVDAAALFVKKTAGHLLQRVPASLFGWSKVIADQLRLLNAEMIGQSPDIPGRKQRRLNFAAIRACAAVDLRRNHL
jgi:hypothetical protein